MIDDKKIESAKEEIYEDRFLLNGEEIVFDNETKEEMFYKEDIKQAIGLGAKWMQEKFLKDLWHPVSEKPRRNTIYLAQIGNCAFDTFFDNKDWEKFSKGNSITRWLYVGDLLPKKGVSNERA